MQIGTKLQFEVPDTCPKTCPYNGDSWAISQGGMCFRCPVMNCKPCYDEQGNNMAPLDPSDFRDDWATEWEQFFKDGTIPEMKFKISK